MMRCKAGHRLSGDNLSMQFDGKGFLIATCRECNRIRAKAWRAANAGKLRRRVVNGKSSGQTIGTGPRHWVNREI